MNGKKERENEKSVGEREGKELWGEWENNEGERGRKVKGRWVAEKGERENTQKWNEMQEGMK